MDVQYSLTFMASVIPFSDLVLLMLSLLSLVALVLLTPTFLALVLLTLTFLAFNNNDIMDDSQEFPYMERPVELAIIPHSIRCNRSSLVALACANRDTDD
jgi:hypothetical protein